VPFSPAPSVPVFVPRHVAPAYYGPWRPWIAWNFAFFIDLTPRPYAAYVAEDPGEGEIATALPPPPPEDDDDLPADSEPFAQPPPPPLELPPFVPPDVQKRGFFDGDEILLQVALLDRASGRLLWVKEAKTDGDPLDRDDVDRALDAVFAGVPWSSR
jgi:hypothetical protein